MAPSFAQQNKEKVRRRRPQCSYSCTSARNQLGVLAVCDYTGCGNVLYVSALYWSQNSGANFMFCTIWYPRTCFGCVAELTPLKTSAIFNFVHFPAKRTEIVTVFTSSVDTCATHSYSLRCPRVRTLTLSHRPPSPQCTRFIFHCDQHSEYGNKEAQYENEVTRHETRRSKSFLPHDRTTPGSSKEHLLSVRSLAEKPCPHEMTNRSQGCVTRLCEGCVEGRNKRETRNAEWTKGNTAATRPRLHAQPKNVCSRA